MVVHRCSSGTHDWGNNLMMALGFDIGNTQRFQFPAKIQKEAESKYEECISRRSMGPL